MTDRHWMINVLEYITVVSTSTRKKVGAIIVSDFNFVKGQGVNSIVRTEANQCMENEDGKTRSDYAMHAEMKAIASAAAKGYSTIGATLYCTIPPCPICCGLIIEAGITNVVYKESYWSENNIHLLTKAGITVRKFNENEL